MAINLSHSKLPEFEQIPEIHCLKHTKYYSLFLRTKTHYKKLLWAKANKKQTKKKF